MTAVAFGCPADAGAVGVGHLEAGAGCTGIVFGDIGTNPLYAFRESLIGHHRLPLDRFHELGVLSLIGWALILVATVKYVAVTMRTDNRGEGVSFTLLAQVGRVMPRSPALP